jgi:hypothetical protein
MNALNQIINMLTSSGKIPPSYMCPITCDVMTNPYIDREGNSYEYDAIVEWISRKKESPITRNYLDETHLSPNRALKEAIEKAIFEHSEPEPVSTPKKIVKEDPKMNEDIEPKVTMNKHGSQLHIRVDPPDNVGNTGINFTTVVDVSTSMDDEVVQKTDKGNEQSSGHSILDLVKHCLKTFVEATGSNDTMTLVPFSDRAIVDKDCNMLNMTEYNKKVAINSIKKLRTEGRTNIWDGIVKSLDLIRKNSANQKNFILLFTDGIPNICPPRGEVTMLQRYFDQFPDLDVSILTFGFGYNIETEKLKNLARNGQYNFIPDSSMMGSILVNGISNVLSTMATSSNLAIELGDTKVSNEEHPILGDFDYKLTSWGFDVNLGPINYGQSKDIILDVDVTSDVFCVLKYKNFQKDNEITPVVCDKIKIPEDNEQYLLNFYRLRAIDVMKNIEETLYRRGDFKDVSNQLAVFIKELETSPVKKSLFIQSMIKDFTGQITEATSRGDWWKRWGRHYLPTIYGAYQNQVCNNFKDNAVQCFGGKLFERIQTDVENKFTSIPLEKGTARYKYSGGARHVTRSCAATSGSGPVSESCRVSSTTYYNRGGGCFLGTCLVKMANGTLKMVEDVGRGDVVMTPNGASTVKGVMKTNFKTGATELVEYKGLVSTPFHPILVNGTWKFPNDLGPIQTFECDSVYTFALETDHVMIINDIQCVCLGHNFKGPVVGHEYFGSSKVITDLSKMPGWKENGVVELFNIDFKRNRQTNRIEKIC